MNQERQHGMRSLGRARGLITVWELMREEERERLRRGGIWTPMIRVLGQGRVATLALPHEMAAQNVLGNWAPDNRHEEEGGGG